MVCRHIHAYLSISFVSITQKYHHAFLSILVMLSLSIPSPFLSLIPSLRSSSFASLSSFGFKVYAILMMWFAGMFQ